MRKISCPLCRRYLKQKHHKQCLDCGARLTLNEFNWFHMMEMEIREQSRRHDDLYEELDRRKANCKDNYKADIQTGVVTDPRGINE